MKDKNFNLTCFVFQTVADFFKQLLLSATKKTKSFIGIHI